MKFLLVAILLLLGCALMAAFLLGAELLDQALSFGLIAGVAAGKSWGQSRIFKPTPHRCEA